MALLLIFSFYRRVRLKLKSIYIFYFILFFNFTILYWFCHISTWIHHRYTRVPPLEPSSLLHPHTTPLGHPSAPVPSIQYSASNLDWRLISYMILSCFNAILPNHPTLSLSHWVQKTVLHISVSFAVSYTGLLLPSFQIPYICISILYCVFFFLAYFTLYNRLQFHPPH